MARVNPKPFMKKAAKVALFGFSTSSSAASLPLNRKTTVEELGVHDQIASFVLPLGMTVNMDGTAIMQVIAAMFVAVSYRYFSFNCFYWNTSCTRSRCYYSLYNSNRNGLYK